MIRRRFAAADARAALVRLRRRLPPKTTLRDLARGMTAELEHRDVTHGDSATTARIALAHLRERPDYYDLLARLERAPRTRANPFAGYRDFRDCVSQTRRRKRYVRDPNAYCGAIMHRVEGARQARKNPSTTIGSGHRLLWAHGFKGLGALRARGFDEITLQTLVRATNARRVFAIAVDAPTDEYRGLIVVIDGKVGPTVAPIELAEAVLHTYRQGRLPAGAVRPLRRAMAPHVATARERAKMARVRLRLTGGMRSLEGIALEELDTFEIACALADGFAAVRRARRQR